MYCVIMAGGSGTRFWPESRERRSKQFLSILGKKSLIQSTITRFQRFVDNDHIYVVARADQKEELEKHLNGIPISNCLYEPFGKNTAPCIGLAALIISEIDPDASMVVSPADHLIRKDGVFRRAVEAGESLARELNGLVTIGISPDRPATGYGYIQVGDATSTTGKTQAYHVKTFAEKPNLATAKRFLKSGDFLWNSGIFIFKATCILEAIEEYLPGLYEAICELKKSLGAVDFDNALLKMYRHIKGISIDYGVMENAKNVFVVEGHFAWSDLGSWEQVYKLSPKDDRGNVLSGDTIILDAENSYVAAKEGLIALVGLDDVIVVREGDATLVCHRDRAEDVKLLVDKLKRRRLNNYM